MAHRQHRSGCPRATHVPSTCGSVTGHGKAKRADRGTLQHAGAEAQGVAGAGLRRGARRQNGCTSLHWAAECRSGGLVRALVECKAEVEARSKVLSGRGCGLRFHVGEGGWSAKERYSGAREGMLNLRGRECGFGYARRGFQLTTRIWK